jgi:DNA transformation protein and related proteins
MPLARLKNLGPASAAWLAEAGIETRAELERIGPVFAYRLVRLRRPEANLLLLWALVGALDGRDWRELGAEEKAALRAEAAIPLETR